MGRLGLERLVGAAARGVQDGLVVWLLRLEGAAALLAGIALYWSAGGEWLYFLPLLLLPDLSIIGYARGPRIGALAYNVVHNWALAGAVLGLGFVLRQPVVFAAGAVLLAHVGVDRLLGYGLKYPTAFRDTHLGRIGRR